MAYSEELGDRELRICMRAYGENPQRYTDREEVVVKRLGVLRKMERQDAATALVAKFAEVFGRLPRGEQA